MVNTISHSRRLAAVRQALILLPLCALCLGQCGCRSPLDMSSLKSFGRSNEQEQYASAYDDGKPPTPLERILQTVGRGREEADRRNFRPAEGIAEFEAAKKLFDAGEFKEAEKEFKRIAKKYEDSQIEEDALFMRAESQFERKRYSWAQDGYDALFEKFPTTRYMNQSTQRLFTIARTWLRFPNMVTSGDVRQVDFEDPDSTPTPEIKSEVEQDFELTRAIPILPNFIDRQRPVFDTEGRALQALKSIWLHDPTGPLADDALMMTASYHLREGDSMEAARVYKILREEYPKSPHLENAFFLGGHVRLMSYQGAAYDGKALQQAKELKESTLRIFPDTDERQRLKQDLEKINEALAARDWATAEFWEKKGKPRAVAVYCRQVLKNYPQTKYAGLARRKLDELRAEAANPTSFGEQLLGVLPDLPGGEPDEETRTAEKPDIPVITDTGEDDETPGLRARLLERLPDVPRLLKIPSSSDDDPETGHSRVE